VDGSRATSQASECKTRPTARTTALRRSRSRRRDVGGGVARGMAARDAAALHRHDGSDERGKARQGEGLGGEAYAGRAAGVVALRRDAGRSSALGPRALLGERPPRGRPARRRRRPLVARRGTQCGEPTDRARAHVPPAHRAPLAPAPVLPGASARGEARGAREREDDERRGHAAGDEGAQALEHSKQVSTGRSTRITPGGPAARSRAPGANGVTGGPRATPASRCFAARGSPAGTRRCTRPGGARPPP